VACWQLPLLPLPCRPLLLLLVLLLHQPASAAPGVLQQLQQHRRHCLLLLLPPVRCSHRHHLQQSRLLSCHSQLNLLHHWVAVHLRHSPPAPVLCHLCRHHCSPFVLFCLPTLLLLLLVLGSCLHE
jgi:hypothetical protein